MAFRSGLDRFAELFWSAVGRATGGPSSNARSSDAWLSSGSSEAGAFSTRATQGRSFGAGALFARRNGEQRVQTRLLQLDPGRVCQLVLGCLVLFTAGIAILHEQLNKLEARRAAGQALTQFESRLEEVLVELQTVSALADGPGEVQACGAALRSRLVRRSLRSLHVSSAALATRPLETDPSAPELMACGPNGWEVAPLRWAGSRDQVTIGSSRTIDARLWAALAVHEQLLVVAELDPRTLADPGEQAMQALAEHGMGLALVAADGRPLSHWGSLSSGGDGQRLLAEQESARHLALTVRVTQSREAWLHAFVRRAALILPLCLLLVAAGLSLYWLRALRRSRMTYRLALALRKRQFEPFAQPIVSLEDGRCIGAEVLMRWKHPQRGIVAPGEFIETAERMGLIGPMSQLIMMRAAHRLSALARRHPQLYFSFNVTPDQLREPGFAAWLNECFGADTLPREQVLLEVTERDVVDDSTQEGLRLLHQQRWRLAIDDFGTGHSSLALLETLPLHSLKIDRAFVNAVGPQTSRSPVLDAIITLGKELRLKLIAEGVETREQWTYLAERGVQCAQGYLMAKPMPLDAFISWVEQRNRTSPTDAAQAADSRATAASNLSTGAESALAEHAELRAVWQRMRSTGGVDTRDRIYHLRTYRQCFVAREAVDGLVRHEGLSRPAAVRLGQRLEALGWLRHVLDEHGFADAELFFEATPAQAAPEAAPPLAELLGALRHPISGPKWKSQTRGLLRHANAASGQDILNWLQARYKVPKATATQWAAFLMRSGALRHTFDDQPIRDDKTLYRLN